MNKLGTNRCPKCGKPSIASELCETCNFIKPQKAFKYSTHGKRHMPFPCYIQPKLNGVRAIFDGETLSSNDQIPWHPEVVAPILKDLRSIYSLIGFPLDGELYSHGLSLQQINSIIAINRKSQHEKIHKITFNIFDIIAPISFRERFEFLRETFIPQDSLRLVETTFVNLETTADQLYAYYRGAGYEGIMYRSPQSPYGLSQNCTNKENRWTHLLKRKDWLDEEFEVEGVEEEVSIEGFPKGRVGAFWFKNPHGPSFKAGTGLSDIDRARYWVDNPIGLICTVKYEMLSDAGVPLKPSIELIHE